MKRTLLLLFVALLMLPCSVYAQSNSLIDSRRNSPVRCIYKLNQNDLRRRHIQTREIDESWRGYLTESSIDESMLHTFVGTYDTDDVMPQLERGNYLSVYTLEDKIFCRDIVIDDIDYDLIGNENVKLYISDSLGNAVPDAKVICRNTRLPFDPKTQTYNAPKIKDYSIIEIEHKGVFHYLTYDSDKPVKREENVSLWRKVQNTFYRIFNPEEVVKTREQLNRERDRGIVVFSKPKYMPGDTVKFKAYLTDYKVKGYNKEVYVHLRGGYGKSKIDTVLTRLNPYRPGMYEWSFPIMDSLGLTLDQRYYINIKKSKSQNERNCIGGSFIFEEYELNKTTLDVKSDKKEYQHGEQVKLTVSATADTGLPMYDGRLSITILPKSPELIGYNPSFMLDTLWQHEFEIEPAQSQEIIIPDSIYPKNVKLDAIAKCVLLNANNEKINKEVQWTYINHSGPAVYSKIEKGILSIVAISGQDTVNTTCVLEAFLKLGRTTIDTVSLPLAMSVHKDAIRYTIKLDNGFEQSLYPRGKDVSCNWVSENDTARFTVNNPLGVPFWYTIRKGNIDIESGYVTDKHLSRSFRHNKQGFTSSVNYLSLGFAERINSACPYMDDRNITMDVNTPRVVYPGQKATVDVLVKNKKGAPVKNVDVTAYALKSTFNSSLPITPMSSKWLHVKPFSRERASLGIENKKTVKRQLEWDRWKSKLGLDSVEYYKFLYPQPVYTYSEPAQQTHIMPYAIVNGSILPVYIVYINGIPHYFKNDHIRNDIYAIVTQHTGNVDVRIRTYDKEIEIKNVYINPGHKNIISVDAGRDEGASSDVDSNRNQITYRSVALPNSLHGRLTEPEAEGLAQYMILLQDWSDRVRNLSPTLAPFTAVYGEMVYELNPSAVTQYDKDRRKFIISNYVVGPFPSIRDTTSVEPALLNVYSDTVKKISFPIVPMYNYYLDKEMIVCRNRWFGSKINMVLGKYQKTADFAQQPLTLEGIAHKFRENIILEASKSFYRKAVTVISNGVARKGGNDVEIIFENTTTIKPAFVYVSIGKDGIKEQEHLLMGRSAKIDSLPAGEMDIHVLATDSTIYSASAILEDRVGLTLLKIDLAKPSDNEEAKARILELLGASIDTPKPLQATLSVELNNYRAEYGKTISGVVSDDLGLMFGATVTWQNKDGRTIGGTATDMNGGYTLNVPGGETGLSLSFSYVGYTIQKFAYTGQTQLDVKLIQGADNLEDAESRIGNSIMNSGFGQVRETIGYVTETVDVSQFHETAVVSVEDMLVGKVDNLHIVNDAGANSTIRIRGNSSFNSQNPPLIVLNGVPQDVANGSDFDFSNETAKNFGTLVNISPNDILNVEVLKGAEAVALFGARAANGALLITTRSGNGLLYTDDMSTGALRRNFHDDAFWKPALATDKNGKVSFEVTYPDDITKWTANFIALDGKGRAHVNKKEIVSFKPQAAQLSLPRFAVSGDSINVIGKLTNHASDTAFVTRAITIDGRELPEERVAFSSLHIDTLAVTASREDSVKLRYAIRKDNGYFDGEERAIPVFPKGITETHGEFVILNDSSSAVFETKATLGSVTLFAQASAVDVFLDEIERTVSYRYMCNEQMASKLKMLVAKKHIFDLTGREFKDQKLAQDLVKRLMENMNGDGLWSWWDKGHTEIWISRQVVEALASAKKVGFTKINFNSKTRRGLLAEMQRIEELGVMGQWRQRDIDDIAIMIRKVLSVDTDMLSPNKNLSADDMKLHNYLRGEADIDSIHPDTLIARSYKTLMGSIYWGEEDEKGVPLARFTRPYGGNIDVTLAVYRILRKAGGYEAELEKIRNYFFEIRRGGSWRNTYESANILETILPDMIGKDGLVANSELTVNGDVVKQFPHKAMFDAGKSISVVKKGSLPIFLTVYQQTQNKCPENDDNGFSLRTSFSENGKEVSVLTAGKTTQLDIEVTVRDEAQYVMIEVPIPAGCTYETKTGRGPYEIHREHFKEKVAIFCSKLPKGTHKFNLVLTPRYTGRYTLNPASAELMYFPTFNGHEAIKTTEIR